VSGIDGNDSVNIQDSTLAAADNVERERAQLVRPAYRNVVLAMVVIGFALNFMDRQILSILMQPIKQDLHLSDTALGFLSGLAFAIFYATLGLPVSRIADRGSRRVVMAISMGLWSLATATSGLARNFLQLFGSRIGVGVGEAGFTPSGLAMIADYFPRAVRGTALGIVNIGPMVGSMAGLLIGGWVAHLWGWRAAFMIAGLPGVIFALLFWLIVREPWRGMADGAPREKHPQPSAWDGTRQLMRSATYVWLVAGTGMSAFALYGISLWMPSFLARSFGFSLPTIGITLGPVIGIVGGAGMIAGGYIMDRIRRRDERWAMWMPAIAALLSIPALLIALMLANAYAAIGTYALAYFLSVLWVAPAFAVIQAIVHPAMRVTATAGQLFVTNLIGLGLGPQVVGLLSDLFAPAGTNSLRYAMMICALAPLFPAVFYMLAARSMKTSGIHAELASAAMDN
jgi:predicted MFS family arabinose efflux permease